MEKAIKSVFNKCLIGFLVFALCLQPIVPSAFAEETGNPQTIEVNEPQAATGLIYNGTEQTGVPAGEHYTLSGVAKATAAGNYTATATLEEGYVWSDGGTDSVEIAWSVDQAELTAAYAGETIALVDTPALAVTVTGFVYGETAATATGYTAPTVTAPETMEAEQSYTIAPAGGAAANYSFIYVAGSLNVTDSGEAGLQPGTYTITANPYIPGSDNVVIPGLTVYLASESFPPASPTENNAILVVGEDGKLTLTIKLTNMASEVFTLQNIESYPGVKVVEAKRGGGPYGSNGVVVPDRIQEFTVELENWSGEYQFGNSMQFPTILNTYKEMPVALRVDFDSAARKYVEPGEEGSSWTETYADETTGAIVTVATTEEAIGPKLTGASLSVTRTAAGERYDAIKQALNELYSSQPIFELYAVALNNSGEELVLTGNTKVSISLPTLALTKADVYSVNADNRATEVWNAAVADGKVSFHKVGDASAMGDYAVLSVDETYKWESKTWDDAATGISATVKVSSHIGKVSPGMTAKDIMNFRLVAGKDTESNPLGTMYKVGFGAILGDSTALLSFTDDSNDNHLESQITLTAPGAEGSGVYLITDNGTSTRVQKLDAVYADGKVKFDLFKEGMTGNQIYQDILTPLYNGGSMKTPSLGTPVSYFLIAAADDLKLASMPLFRPLIIGTKISLPYNGLEQGLIPGNHSTMTGTSTATDAGTYTATVTPDAGYVWADGTANTIEIEWFISKVELKATYVSESINPGGMPALQFTIDSSAFVNGETAETAKDFVYPAVIVPDVLVPGKKYSLAPVGGSAANYEFKYTANSLYVNPSKPQAPSGLVYNGAEQIGVEKLDAFTFTGTAKATAAGEYTVTVKLAAGFFWSEGGRDPIVINWSIAPSDQSPGDPDEMKAGTYRITANLYLPGELNTELPGVTAYLTNPNNPLGIGGHTGIPDTPAADNATLVVGTDGSQTIILDVVNPVFTLQHIEDGTNARIAGQVRDHAIYSGNTGVSRNGRITQLYIVLDDASGTYEFPDSVEFPTLLEVDWHVPLKLGVDFENAVKISDNTEVNLPDPTGEPEPENHEVVVTPGTPEINVNVPAGVTDATVNVAALLGAPAGGKVSATLPELNISANTSVSTEPVTVSIPTGTVVSAPEGWNGIINAPTVRANNSITVTPDSGKSVTVNAVIEVGSNDVPLIFDRAVRILIPGQAGKDAGYSRGGVFTKITHVLSADSQSAGDALAPGSDGKIAVGDDLVIWTKHFTSFIAYTQTQLSGDGGGGTPSPGGTTGFEPGTHIVTANIFLKKEDTKLPVNPHLTSGVFPPKDPATHNATLIVAADGTAKLNVPIPITVMTLNSVSGLDLLDMEKDGSGAIKSLTINLGKLSGTEKVIRKGLNVSVTLSELAQSVSGLAPNQNWPATFELYLVGAPTSDSPGFSWEDYVKQTGQLLGMPGQLKAGTYRITANLYLPGELNTQLPGVTAYLTNPNNPLGIGGHKGIPDTPATANATLVVGADGLQTIILDVVNPVFTLQKIKDGANVHIVGQVRDDASYSGNTGVSRNGRITKLYMTLDDSSGKYVFSESVEFPTLLETDWNVPLTLKVDFASAEKISDSTEVIIDEEDAATAKTTKTTKADGTVVTTVNKADGSTVISMATLKGSTSETVIDAKGKSASVIALSDKEAAQLKAGAALPLPMPGVTVTNRVETAPSIILTSLGSGSVTSLLVSIPASQVTPGTVVVMVKQDGKTQIVARTKYHDGKIVFAAEKNVTYKLVDNSKSFRDVDAVSWYADAVRYMSAREWMQGSGNDFSPSDRTSRGMIVTILHRMAGVASTSAGSRAFADVTSGKYYADAVAWASALGIASGYGDGNFGVNDSITREQLAVMLWRYADSPTSSGELSSFTDQDQVSGFAAEALAWAVEKGIMSGKGKGNLDPRGQATRAEIAQMMMNFMAIAPTEQ